MATVTEAVKESLLGSTVPDSLSGEAKATFLKHSRAAEDGELYMNEEDFIAAIAPPEEDYVSRCRIQLGPSIHRLTGMSWCSTKSSENNMASSLVSPIDTNVATSP
jgi:hypothetical protein